MSPPVVDYRKRSASGGGAVLDASLVKQDVTCDSSVYVGAVVRINGAGTFVNAQADSATNSNAVGICISKSNSTTCDIQVAGVTGDIFVGLTSGATYFLDPTTAGALTTTIPTGSGEVVTAIGTGCTSTAFIVDIKLRMQRAL